MNLKFYGGDNEIGGNKVLLGDNESKIFLDFGISFDSFREFFDFPLIQPANIYDLLKVDAIPKLKNLYAIQGSGKPFVDAVLISHAHLDHCGYISLLRNDIPIHIGDITKRILEIRFQEYPRTWDRRISHLDFKLFKTGDEIEINDIRIRPIHVDHSIPAAYGFIVNAKDTIAYTGDLRVHGYREDLTKDFIKELKKEEIKYLICEGTNVSEKPTEEDLRKLDSEDSVRKKLLELVKASNGLVVHDQSSADIDRVRTIWQVAKESGRKLVIDSRLAWLVLEINKEEGKIISDLPKLGDFYIYLTRRKKRYSEEYIEVEKEERCYHEFELVRKSELQDVLIAGPNGREAILNKPEEFILCTTNGMSMLLQFKPVDKGIPGTYVYSKAEPYNEETEIPFEKLKNWIRICGMQLEYAHTSGHCSVEDLRNIVETANPEILVPIHTRNEELFRKLFKARVVLPREF